jgi:hypothetical protein
VGKGIEKLPQRLEENELEEQRLDEEKKIQ